MWLRAASYLLAGHHLAQEVFLTKALSAEPHVENFRYAILR